MHAQEQTQQVTWLCMMLCFHKLLCNIYGCDGRASASTQAGSPALA
jgi:hypothetical protein